MNEIIKPGAGILFMKVGTHAREDLSLIIARKSREIEQTGYAMWGYGGNTCHPRTMVQPFAEMFSERHKAIHLCMEEMKSTHYAEPLRADEFSPDGIKWDKIPETIHVLGSRFALVIKDLRQMVLKLPLEQTRVSIGPNTGRLGSRYIKGQVDKACLEITEVSERVNEEDHREIEIHLVAELAAPYAVFLRSQR